MYRGSQYQTPSRFCREFGILALEEVKKSESGFNRNQYGNSYNKSYGGGYGSSSGYGGYSKNSGDGSQYIDRHNDSSGSGIKFFNHSEFMKKEEKKSAPLKDVSVYKVGQTVVHTRFGMGKIVEISEDGLVGDIIFEVGKKSLMLELAPLEIIEE